MVYQLNLAAPTMNKYKINYFFDSGSGICLWSADINTENAYGYAIEFDSIPLSSNTIKWLKYLIAWFDTAIDWTNPGEKISRWTVHEEFRFQLAFQKGLKLLQLDLDPDLYEVSDCFSIGFGKNDSPEEANFFGVLTTSKSKEEIAILYENNGWLMRKCSETDFEISTPTASIVIDGINEILMHGLVAYVDLNINEIVYPLAINKISYKVEIYSAEDEVILTQENLYCNRICAD